MNGCFWHRCPRCALPLPKSHSDFWRKKFELNEERDMRKNKALKLASWRVVTVWECEIKEDVDRVVLRIKRALRVSGVNVHGRGSGKKRPILITRT